MANELEKAITVRDVINKIDAGDLLLPSIQRRFVWDTKQIEFLFDSIMQDYPINTFMFWSVTAEKIKNQFRFYDFLRKYVEYSGGNNQERITKGYKDFEAVIDGQQRLNSLYIGLKGSHASKKYVYRKKKYQQDEQDYPSQKLYLDLLGPIENDEEKKRFDFRFLIHNQHEQQDSARTKSIVDEEDNTIEVDCFWFEVGKMLEFKNEHSVVKYLNENALDLGGFPGETLLKLFKLTNDRAIINYYLEKDQDFDKVLYEFIRTNSGGTTLSFADLLMSIITASWEIGRSTKGAREEFDALVRQVKELGFDVEQDFILKTCLVLFSEDIRFALKNFQGESIQKIKSEWGRIGKSIKATFQLVNSLSFNNHSLRSKNALIPIIYYVYWNEYAEELNKDNKHVENKAIIKKYLHLALLNKVFGTSSDGFLKKVKQTVKDNLKGTFPLEQLITKFRGTNRSFIMDDERMESILRTSYDSLDSFYVLALLFPKFNFEFKNPNIDHLHPRSQFENSDYAFLDNDEDIEFYEAHWNSVLNLALLSSEQNQSKNKSELKKWTEKQEKHNQGIRNSLFIPEEVDLELENFREFIEQREIILKAIITQNTA